MASTVKNLTQQIQAVANEADKLRVLVEDWQFPLPMATAILTVLYPDRFTVYDVRVREQLGIKDFAGRKDQTDRYFRDFLPKVQFEGQGETLRNKDRYLWGKSWYEDLQELVHTVPRPKATKT